MKNLKLHTIISGIMFTCTALTHAMDSKTLSSSLYNLANAVTLGTKRMLYGNSALLEQELDNFDQNLWNEINAANLVNRALDESKDNPVKASHLLLKIKAHNNLHPDKPYNVSDLAKGLVRGAVENHYKTEEQKALRETQDLINNLLIRFRQQYQACVEQSKVKETNLKELAEIITFTKGAKPDEHLRSVNFNTQRTLRLDLLDWLQIKDEFAANDNSLVLPEEEFPKHSSNNNNNNNNIQSQTNPIKQAIDIVIETTQNTTTTTTTTSTTNAASDVSLENQDQTSSNNTSNNSTTSTTSLQSSGAGSDNNWLSDNNSSNNKKKNKKGSNNNLKILENQ